MNKTFGRIHVRHQKRRRHGKRSAHNIANVMCIRGLHQRRTQREQEWFPSVRTALNAAGAKESA